MSECEHVRISWSEGGLNCEECGAPYGLAPIGEPSAREQRLIELLQEARKELMMWEEDRAGPGDADFSTELTRRIDAELEKAKP